MKWSALDTVTVVDNNNYKYETLKVSVTRLKTEKLHQMPDEVVHYVHATNMKRCYVFAMAYSMIMDNSVEPSEYMFPSWKTQVKFTQHGTESNVSQKFSKYWDNLIGIAQEYVEYISSFKTLSQTDSEVLKLLELLIAEAKGKTMHMGKKGGIEILGDSNLAPQVSHIELISKLVLWNV